jgi:probable rRNA maturation factor
MNPNCPGDSSPPSLPLADNDPRLDQQAFRILVANEQATLTLQESHLIAAVQAILVDSQFATAYISIAVVDDPTIHALNVQYLQHNYPTDVLSFVLEETEDRLEGELVVSTDTALREAAEAGWSPQDELLLYIIHGMLHLVGYDDHAPADQVEMYAAEAHYLQALGITLPTDSARWTSASGTNETGRKSS